MAEPDCDGNGVWVNGTCACFDGYADNPWSVEGNCDVSTAATLVSLVLVWIICAGAAVLHRKTPCGIRSTLFFVVLGFTAFFSILSLGSIHSDHFWAFLFSSAQAPTACLSLCIALLRRIQNAEKPNLKCTPSWWVLHAGVWVMMAGCVIGSIIEPGSYMKFLRILTGFFTICFTICWLLLFPWLMVRLAPWLIRTREMRLSLIQLRILFLLLGLLNLLSLVFMGCLAAEQQTIVDYSYICLAVIETTETIDSAFILSINEVPRGAEDEISPAGALNPTQELDERKDWKLMDN